MPIQYTDVEHSEHLRKAALYGAKEFVRCNIDPVTAKNFHSGDYEFQSCFLTKQFLKMADRIENFIIRPDDIWVMTFPKSGTTWVVNIVYQLMHNIDLSTDFWDQRYNLSLEAPLMLSVTDENINDEVHMNRVRGAEVYLDFKGMQPSPRLMKTHLPAHLVPKNIWTVKPKIIHVYRNPKDVVISMYHMYKNHSSIRYPGTVEDFLDIFLNDHVVYAPFFGHVNSFEQFRSREHILFLNYEEMTADPFCGVKKISEFLNFSYSNDELKKLTAHLSFQNMHDNIEIDQSNYPSGFK